MTQNTSVTHRTSAVLEFDHKERMIRDRKIELGTKILEGLRHSLANKVVTEVVLLQ